MEYLQDQLLPQLPFYAAISPYLDELKPYLGPVYPILNSMIFGTTSMALPFLKTTQTILSRITTDQNPLVTLGIGIATLFVALKMMGWVKRQLMFWLGLALQLVLWVSVALVGAALWVWGPERCLNAVMAFASEVQGERNKAEKNMAGSRGRQGWR